jgi:hypothetical protein
MKSLPAFSIGTSKRGDISDLKQKKEIPGPGNYSSLNDSIVKQSAPKFGFGTSNRDE